MVGLQNNEISLVPFNKAVKLHKEVRKQYLQLSDVLSI